MAPSRKSSDKWIKVSAWCFEKQIQLLSSVIGDQFNKLCSARISAVMQGLKKNVYKERSKALHIPHKCEVVLFAP